MSIIAQVEERKQKAWEDCEALLRAAGGCKRKWKDVRKKWQELKTRALACPVAASREFDTFLELIKAYMQDRHDSDLTYKCKKCDYENEEEEPSIRH